MREGKKTRDRGSEMHVSVPAIPPGKLTGEHRSESSSIIQKRVQKARDTQLKRF